MIRNKNILVSILLFWCLATTANFTIDTEYIQSWKASYINSMTLSEKQMLANLLHLLHANSIIEFKVRQFSTPIARLNQAIRTNITHYKSPTEDLATLKTLIDRLSFVAATRTIYIETLNTCISHYNENKTPIVDSAIASLQIYAQSALRNWADETIAQTNGALKKSSIAIGETIQHFQGLSNLHSAMSEGKLPLEIDPTDEMNKSLYIFSILTTNNPELLDITEKVINTLNETSDHAAQIISVGQEIYKQFYIVLYDILMSPTCDHRYTTTLFSMHDTLSDEYKSPLPHPDKVFEHMLQTTKMYTQTEFSPL